MRFFNFVSLVSVFFSSASLHAALAVSTPPLRVQSLISGIEESMIHCPERVWPNLSWKTIQVLLRDDQNQKSYLWNDPLAPTPFSTNEVNYQSLPLDLSSGDFGISQYEQKTTLSVSINALPEYPNQKLRQDGTLYLITHEGFHLITQPRFTKTPPTKRGVEYPSRVEPSYYRLEIIEALANAYKGATPETDLDRAAYWQEQLDTHYPDVVQKKRGYDVVEGSAEYVSLISSAIAALGCQAPESDLEQLIQDRIFKEWFDLQDTSKMIRNDYYVIGTLSGLLLRKLGVKNWEKEVESTVQPLQVLLKNRLEKPQTQNDVLYKKVADALKKSDQKLAPIIDPLISKIQSAGEIRVVIPWEWIHGAIDLGTWVDLLQFPDYTVGSKANFQGEPFDQKGKAEFSGAPLIFTKSHPCSTEPAFFGIVSKAEKEVNSNGALLISSNGISIQAEPGHFKSLTDQNGQDWVCLK